MQEVAASERIILEIGEKSFHTTKATIAESRVLSTLVSLRPPAEGPYFVDADPVLFEHVLRYLRTGMFPVLYDQRTGQHDECLYFSLLTQAKFYQIDRLRDWIANKSYRAAVQRRTWASSITLCGEKQIERIDELTHLEDENLQVLRVEATQSKCYRCPNGNWKHDGHRSACLRDGCAPNLISSTSNDYNMRVLKVDYVVTAIRVRPERALAQDSETAAPPPYH